MKDNLLPIAPYPLSVTRKTGVFESRDKTPISVYGGAFQKEAEVFVGQLGERAHLATSAEGAHIVFRNKEARDNNEESYALSIDEGKIEVCAEGGKGAYRAAQVVRQLLLQKDGAEIPCCYIEDAPAYSWRGFMLDCSRHFYEVDTIKKLLDALSLFHYNIFHWHITDDQGWRLPVDAYPALTETGSKRKLARVHINSLQYNKDGTDPDWASERGFYTKSQIKEVIDFARERHIEVVPEVDLPGHTRAALACYPELGCTGGPYTLDDSTGIFEDILCAGNDKIFDFVSAVLDSVCALFPSAYIHIGGDEAPTTRWEHCPKCAARMKALRLTAPRELQAYLTSRFAGMAAERGKTAIGWDEVLEGTDGAFPLPKELIVMSWRGVEGGVEAAARSHRVIMSSAQNGAYLDFKHLPAVTEPGAFWGGANRIADAYNMNPAPEGVDKSFVLGGQANLWSELILADKMAEYMIFPRAAAIAEALWLPSQNKNWDSFKSRLPCIKQSLAALDVLCYNGVLE